MYFQTFAQINKQLGQLEKFLDAAEAHGAAKSFDPSVLLVARLAPDQFHLGRQIQVVCDTAKLGAARLTGKDAPTHPDTEQTLAELRERIKAVRTFLAERTEADYASAASAVITQPRWKGECMTGENYFREHVVPNFYFHLVTAYSILRHNGVSLGKRDYLGALTKYTP